MSEIKSPDSQEHEKNGESVIDSSKPSHAASTKNGSVADQAKGNPVTTEVAATSNTINEIKEKAGFLSRYLGYVKEARKHLKLIKGNRYIKILDTGLNVAANLLEAGDFAVRGEYKKAIVSGAKGVGALAGGAITGAATAAALAPTGPFATAGIFLIPEAANLGAKAGEKVLGDIAQYAVNTFWPDGANNPDKKAKDTPNKTKPKKQAPGLYDANGTKFQERHGDSEKGPVVQHQKTFIDKIHDEKLQAEIDKLLEADAKANEAAQISKTVSNKVKYKWNPDDFKPSSSQAKSPLVDIPPSAIPKTKAATSNIPKLDLPNNPPVDKTIKQPSDKDSGANQSDKSVLRTILPNGNLSDPMQVDSCYEKDRCDKYGPMFECDGVKTMCIDINKSFSGSNADSEEHNPQDPITTDTSEPQTYTPPDSSSPGSSPDQTSLLRHGNFAPALHNDFAAATGTGFGAGLSVTINQSVSVGAGADAQQVTTAMNEANIKAQDDWEGIVANLFRDQRRVEYGATSGIA